MEADEGESLSEKRDSEKLIKGGGAPGPVFGAWGRLVIVGSLVRSFYFWQIDGPKYFLYVFFVWPWWGRLDFTASLVGFQD